MRRRVMYGVQARIKSRVRRIESTPVTQWPEHIKRAWEILPKNSKITEKTALALIVDSICAAQLCLVAVNRRSDQLVEGSCRHKLCAAFKRLARCCRRASAALRNRLDGAIAPRLQHGYVDLELVEDILDAAVIELDKFPKESAAKTARATMLVTMADREPSNWIKNAYGGLHPESQRNSELALAKLRNQEGGITAAAVFEALASALDAQQPRKTDIEVNAIVRDYVAAVASLWRGAGLYPSRARNFYDPTYTSRVHRFADLILTAVVEPWSLRHVGNLADIRKQLSHRHAELPVKLRKKVSRAPRQCHQAWLVSEYILRQALSVSR